MGARKEEEEEEACKRKDPHFETRGRRLRLCHHHHRHYIMYAASSHKSPLVIELGARVVRAGISGEMAPRRSYLLEDDELALQSNGYAFSSKGAPSRKEWLRRVLWVLRSVYFEKLLLRPRGRRVYVCAPLFGLPRKCEEAVYEALFEHFDAPLVHVAPSPGLIILPTGCLAGVSVDVGFRETRVVAVVGGTIVANSFFSSPSGMRMLLEKLQVAAVVADGNEKDMSGVKLSMEALEGLAERLFGAASETSEASSAFFYARRRQQNGTRAKTAVRMRIDNPQDIANEVFFSPSAEASIAAAFANCLDACPHDILRLAAQNVVVVGECASFRGFKASFLACAKDALSKKSRLSALDIAVHDSDIPPGHHCWLGASLAAAALSDELVKTSVTAEMYRATGPGGGPPMDEFDLRTHHLNSDDDGEDERKFVVRTVEKAPERVAAM